MLHLRRGNDLLAASAPKAALPKVT